MNTDNILCLLCGSLITCALSLILSWRQDRIDDKVIKHIRRNAYRSGWADGRDSTWRAD